MRWRIVKYFTIVVCCTILGWMLCLFFEDISYFTLSKEISTADVLSIVVDIVLACAVAFILDKHVSESRVEKDFFIGELDAALEILKCIDRKCSHDTTLSFSETNYDLGRLVKTLANLWKLLEERDNSFYKRFMKKYELICENITSLNAKLTDSGHYNSTGFTPISIARGNIHLNNSVKPDIDKTIGEIKNELFKFKLAINEK